MANQMISGGRTIHFSKSMLIGLCAVMSTPWVVVTVLALQDNGGTSRSADLTVGGAIDAASMAVPLRIDSTQPSVPAPSDSEIRVSRVGPWGQMQMVPIVLELPDDYVFLAPADFRSVKWTFSQKSREQAIEILRAAGLTDEQLRQASGGDWAEDANGSTLAPGDALILSLSPEGRANLYGRLVRDKANQNDIDPFWYRPGQVDFRLRGSELAPESLALLKRLLYPGGNNVLLFNDVDPAVRSIADPLEQRRFAKAVSRKRSLMSRLIVNANSDVSALSAYWGVGGREKDIAPILNALKFNVDSGVETPSQINIVALLPAFARERLYNHAYSTQRTDGRHEDCFWTAFNFFSTDPDYEINDMTHLAKIIDRDYYKIGEASRLGDVVLLVDDAGNAIHAANYIADEVIFTKNGVNFTQPWLLSTMKDMLDTYRIRSPECKPIYFRRKL